MEFNGQGLIDWVGLPTGYVGVGLVFLMIMGKLFQLWVSYAWRGTKEVRHPINVLFKNYFIKRVGEDAYLTERGQWRSWGGSPEMHGFLLEGFSRKAAEKCLDEHGLSSDDTVEIVTGEGATTETIKSILLTLFTGVATFTVYLMVCFPEVLLPLVGLVLAVMGSRIIVDCSKAVVKLNKATQEHINDKNAHTDNAKDIDTDIDIGLK